jgi:endonuclease/exonuclease/phosphatase family metal-dependent hydrolase
MQLKVMTWNVENLFRPGQGDGPDNQAAYDAKIKNLSDVIKLLDPDVLAVQEIGSVEAFEDLQAALGDAYPNGETGTPGDRGIRVGILSKLELVEPQSIVQFAPNASIRLAEENGNDVTTMRRGALWVKIRPEGGPLINVIGVHLKSKLLEFPKAGGGTTFSTKDEALRARTATLALAERTMEAFTLRLKANDIVANNKTQGLIVLGDFNDVPEAASNQIVQGPDGSQPGHGAGFDREDKGDDVRLFNLGGLIPPERRYSRINEGVKELIDQIFVSEELVPLDKTGKTRIVPVVDARADLQNGLPSVTNDPNSRKNKPTSDHAPVIATFDL